MKRKKELEQLPQPGDVIYVQRKWKMGLPYKHYGVFIGNDGGLKDQVIHFSGKEETIAFKADMDIIQTSLQDFLMGGKLHIQKSSICGWVPFTDSEIIKRAKANVGKHKDEYSLVFRNCEHFANWCRFGRNKSTQVGNVAKKVVKIAATVAVVIVTKVLIGNEKKDKKSNFI